MFTSWQVNFADSRKIFYELILRIALKYMKFNISKFNPLKSVSFLSLTSRFVLQNIFLSYFYFLSDLLLTISLFYHCFIDTSQSRPQCIFLLLEEGESFFSITLKLLWGRGWLLPFLMLCGFGQLTQ